MAMRSSARERLSVYATIALVAMAWTWFAGKDVPWDALHYHVYAGYSALNERLTVDLFPAGSQTYLNPYSHVPLYLMVRAGWPALAIGMTFALIHSAMLCLVWELARGTCRRPDGTSPAIVSWAAIGLALFNPVLLQEVGSTFNDVTTGTLALGGYVALVSAFAGGRISMVGIGGFLLGGAAAFKLSNAALALAPAVPLVWGAVTTTRQRIRATVVFAACACIGALVVAAPWAWRLEQAFGNPVFPMLDGLFKSPGFAAVPAATAGSPPMATVEMLGHVVKGLRDPRFIPASLVDAMTRPFDILSARRFIHTEPMAADVRYAALLAIALVGLGALAWRRMKRSYVAPVTTLESGRAFVYLVISFASAWIIWLAISGNSRYFLPMACVAAVLVVAGLYRLFSAVPRFLAYSLIAVFGIQGALLWLATDFRWNPQRWDGPWMQVSVPPRLQTEPYLYLPMDTQSQSFLLPWLAPGSAFMGITTDLHPDGFGGRRAKELLAANTGRLRMLKLVETIESDGRPVLPNMSRFDFPLRRFGLQVDPDDCEFIRYKGNPNVVELAGPRSGPRDEVQIYSCRVVPGGGLSDVDRESKRIADLVLDRVEDACPDLFPPSRGGGWRSGSIWRRNYADLVLWVTDEGAVRFADLARGGGDSTVIGRASDWIHKPQKLKCWLNNRRAYVQLENGLKTLEVQP